MDELDDEILIGEGVRLRAGSAPLPFRIASGAIDAVVYGGAAWLAGSLVFGGLGSVNAALAAAIVVLFFVVFFVLVPATVETLTRGLSAGRLALGLRIVRDDGGPVSFRHAFARAAVGLFELWGLIGTLAIAVAMLSARGKRVGDLLAGTYALRTRGDRRALPPVTMPPALAEWSRTADISRLPDGLALTARLFLGRAPTMHPPARARLGTRIASEFENHVAPRPPVAVHPETFIAAVLAARRDREYAIGLRSAERTVSQGELLRRLPHGVPDVEN